ncbi:uncharacterized protein C8R40DRAFT_1051189, partial [Lentinula edodes]|uniref:uncharacterized protein n=1 Tax=Lentinula edodes TaxID=5353 RepID=UPI001E8DBF26
MLTSSRARPAAQVEQNVDQRVKTNFFTQSWNIKKGALPDSLQRLLKTAQTFGLRLEGRNISKEIRRSRPIWYHNNADSRIRLLNNSRASECLRSMHNLQTVGQAEDMAKDLETPEHISWNECECRNCVRAAEENGCQHPHNCFTRAKALLDTLEPKWDP